MNKSELIDAVKESAGISKKDAEKAVTSLFDIIVEKVAAGEEVRVVGFGTFECHERSERVGCNPQTKEKITIPASKVPAFKAGKAFKAAVDK